jgi:hypothetical protein
MTASAALQSCNSTTGDQPRRANHQGVNRVKASTEKNGPLFGCEPNYGPEISDGLVRRTVGDVLSQYPAPQLAELCDVSDETIRNWQRRKRTPHFAEGLRVATKVPKLERAIIERMRQGKLNPQPDALLDILFDGLLEIQAAGGTAGRKAREVLKRFSAAKGRA